ncbi:hypothetical protein MITS9509_00674 [Synechococcus sp. MIT S9509]|nr:hypothetical protein MITS9504_00302 [Synechococcus sp. MIT S9504]KZR93379.1 hypothetical protein MITS9509_00674 [Synechococcus sp. MIT S9509]
MLRPLTCQTAGFDLCRYVKAVDRIVLNDRDTCQSMANYWVIYLQH